MLAVQNAVCAVPRGPRVALWRSRLVVYNAFGSSYSAWGLQAAVGRESFGGEGLGSFAVSKHAVLIRTRARSCGGGGKAGQRAGWLAEQLRSAA